MINISVLVSIFPLVFILIKSLSYRWTHHWHNIMRSVRKQALQLQHRHRRRPRHRPVLCRNPQGSLPAGRRCVEEGGPRQRERKHLRHLLPPQLEEWQRDSHVRPGALDRRLHEAYRRAPPRPGRAEPELQRRIRKVDG